MGVFKDSNAKVGRPKAVIHDKTLISATSPSRSLASLIKKKDRLIKVEILDNGLMRLDFSNVIGNKIQVSPKNAKALAKFIIATYSARKKEW